MKTSLILLASALGLVAAGEAGHHLATLSLGVVPAGLFAAYAAARLPPAAGLLTCLALGAAVDAGRPIPFGTSAFALGLVHGLIAVARRRWPEPRPWHWALAAGGATGVHLSALTAVLLLVGPAPAGSLLGRAAVDLALSSLAAGALAPFWAALLDQAHRVLGLDPDPIRLARP